MMKQKVPIPIPKQKRFLLSLLFLFSVIQNVSAQEMVWPTNASQLLSATFGEYRSSHFHAGIDIKTWGQEGYPVYAAAEGSVVRLQVSPYGYGRAVYLRTQSGHTVVCGHLSRFNDRIEELVREEQIRQGRYRVQMVFRPEELPFARGEILAYSGSTGIGAPHLHFEIRDSLNRPVNPLGFGFPIRDTIAPEIQAVAFSPLAAGSHVNGDFKPDVIRVTHARSSLHVLNEPLIVHGRLGVSVAATDFANDAPNLLGAYRFELWIDSACVYQFRNDCFSYDETDLSALMYDRRIRTSSDLKFFNLFREKGNSLAYYPPFLLQMGVICSGEDEKEDDGSIYLSEGTHTLWIVVSDYFGNQSEVFGDFMVSAAALPEIPAIEEWIQNPENLPDSSGAHGILSKRFLRDYLYFSADGSVQPMNHPSLIIRSGLNREQVVPLIQTRPGRFAGYFPLSLIQNDVLQISLSEGPNFDRVLDRMNVPVFRVRPDEPATPVSADGRFSVHFARQSVYESLWCTVESASDPDTYQLLPDDVALRESVRLYMRIPDSGADRNRLALYRVAGDGGYVFEGNQWDADYLTARVNRMGTYVALQDTIPPEILSIRPRNRTVSRDRTPGIRVAFRDLLSGIGNEEDYVVRLDGKRLIMEYDPEENVALHQLIAPIQPGEHIIDIVLRDRCGNTVQRISRFVIQ